MSAAKDASETEALGGAELSVLPDGTISVVLEGRGELLHGRFLGDFGPGAALLAGPAPFSAALAAIAERLAARGAGVLVVTWDAGRSAPANLDAAAAFLRLRGAQRVTLAACGDAARWALAAAERREVLGLALLSPEQIPAGCAEGFSACRAVILCGDDDEEARALAGRIRGAELKRFARAGAPLREVAADAAAVVVERFASVLAPARSATPGKALD